MTCRKCKARMEQLAHIAHGKRKFRCPKCGKHRMQEGKTKKDRKARSTKLDH